MDALRLRLTALLRLAALLAALAPPVFSSPAADQQPLEYQVKAAFLLKFTGFIEWPPAPDASANTPFAVCILGDDPFGHVLDQLVEGENVNGRKIVVRRIRRETLSSCAVVYVSAEEKNAAPLLASAGPGVLTVGEGDGFLDEGGMIAFVLDNRRVRFDIDSAAVRRAGLRISSKLLNVARIVR